MPLTRLDPTAALVLVDLQQGVVGSAHPDVPAVLDTAVALADAFRSRGLPVVLVTVIGGAPGRTDAAAARTAPRHRPEGWADIAPALDGYDDIRIAKRTWGAFHGTGLDEALRSRGVTQVVIGGVATSTGVESTARAAHEHGYHVVLAVDAMLDPDRASHDHSVTTVFPRLGEVTTAHDVIAALTA
ncbi:isochorismatase family protein [Amnibacterium endophyticum]|uniref:Isochorismatase family protein n=1 Tax=Amnibacterium endophyticum TaxID=2109337 RepID=A0ABW4LHP3_9MICO